MDNTVTPQLVNALGGGSIGAVQPSNFAPVSNLTLLRLLEGTPPKKVSFPEWWRWKWHNMPRVRLAMETTNGLISAFSAGIYVYDTYIKIPHVARIVYFVASWTILVEFVCKLFASNNKLKYLFWSLSLIDTATIAFGLAYYWDTDGVSNGVSFIRALRMLQVVRFMRVLVGLFLTWLKGAVHPSQIELYKHLFDLLIMVAMVVFIGGCAFYEIEQVNFGDTEASPVYLHEGIYWACVTLTTVGYGDFFPTNVVTQMLFPVMIGIILVIVPAKVSALNTIMDSITPYMRRAHNAYRFGEHVVLMGHTNHKTTQAFVDEFFAPDHGLQEMQLVILRNDPPGPDMRVMLSGHRAAHRLQCLQGSPFVVEDLLRTDLTRAMAVFVMCNKFSQDVEQEDTQTLMIVLALSQYIRQNTDCGSAQWSLQGRGGNGKLVQGWGSESWKQQATKWMQSSRSKDEVPHIIVQFHLPESVQRARQLLDSQASHPLELGLLPVGSTLFPMCLGSIKHAMLGASLHTPGLLTLISNLTMSCQVSPEIMPENGSWIWEYLNGAGIEMYEVQLPNEVHGMSYVDALDWLYEVHGAILLGVRLNMRELQEPERYNVHLTPFNAPNLHLDVRIMMGIIMSQDEHFQGIPHLPYMPKSDNGLGAVPGKMMDLDETMVLPTGNSRANNEAWDHLTSFHKTSSHDFGDIRQSGPLPRPVSECLGRKPSDAAGTPRVAPGPAHQTALDSRHLVRPQPLQQPQQQQQQPEQRAPQEISSADPSGTGPGSGQGSATGTDCEAGLAGPHGGAGAVGGQGRSRARRGPQGSGGPGPVAEGVEHGARPGQGPCAEGVKGGSGGPAVAAQASARGWQGPGLTVEVLAGVSPEDVPLQIMQPPMQQTRSGLLGQHAAGGGIGHSSSDFPTNHGSTHSSELGASNPQQPQQHERRATPLRTESGSLPATTHAQQSQQPGLPPTPFQMQAPPNSQGALPSPFWLSSGTTSSMDPKSGILPHRHSSHACTDPDATNSSSGNKHTLLEGRMSAGSSMKKVRIAFGPSLQTQQSHPFQQGDGAALTGNGLTKKTPCARSPDPREDLAARCGSISKQAAIMQRFTKAQTLKMVQSCKELELGASRRDLILIIGDSCFPYLNDLIASIRGMRRTPLAAAVELARKQSNVGAYRHWSSQGEEEGSEKGPSHDTPPTSEPAQAAFPHKNARWEQKQGDKERELSHCPIIIMDPTGPNPSQVSTMFELEDVSLLQGNPFNPKDMGKLDLSSGCRVRALVLPFVADLDENAVTGSKMSLADAHTITNCSNLRQYCNLVGANLEIVTEALSFVNVSYLLPLCISGPPYDKEETEEEDPVTALDSIHSMIKVSSMTRSMAPMEAKPPPPSLQRIFSSNKPHSPLDHATSIRRAGTSPQGHPFSDVPKPLAADWRLKRKHQHLKALKPSLKSSVVPSDLPSKFKSLAPDSQYNRKLEDFVEKLLANIPALAPALATGHIYTAYAVDKLFCMILFNPLLIQIITKMLGVWECDEIEEEDVDILPLAISILSKGGKSAPNSKDSTGSNELLMQEARRLKQRQQEMLSKQEERLYNEQEGAQQTPPGAPRPPMGGRRPRTEPPSAYYPRIHLLSVYCFNPGHSLASKQPHLGIPQTWGCLFFSWIHRKLLPIGLYRRDPDTEFPYVYTSPSKATILRSTDMVYVLACEKDLPQQQ